MPSSVTRESPVDLPSARKKLKAIAPPMSSVSATSRKRSMRAILSIYLRAAEHDHERAFGALDERAQSQHLALQQEARRRRKVLRDALRGGVRPVRRSEGVVHIGLGERRQLARQVGIVPRLAAFPARVLEHEHGPGDQPIDAAAHLGPDDLGRLMHRPADQLAQTLRDRRQRGLGVAPPGTIEVRAEDLAGAALAQELDRRERGPDARVVGHTPVLERNVEVHPDQDRVAVREPEVAHGALAERRGAR